MINHIETPVITLVEARNALAVIALDRSIRAHLESTDPQALVQVEAAISSLNTALNIVPCTTKDGRHLYNDGRCCVCDREAVYLGSY